LKSLRKVIRVKTLWLKNQSLSLRNLPLRKNLDLPKASEIPIAKRYLEKRLLNPEKFYFANKFQEWTNTQKPTFSRIVRDESRIVIPLYTREGELFGFQGRSLGPSNVKYITVILDESIPKVYGLDEVSTDETIYVTEGPFDSTFVENAIAMCGSDILLDSLNLGDDIVYVLDNEPATRKSVTGSPNSSTEVKK
jgi:hypothetical protein